MLSYRNRLLLIGTVVTVAVLGTVFLQAPAPTLTVDQLIETKLITSMKMSQSVEKYATGASMSRR